MSWHPTEKLPNMIKRSNYFYVLIDSKTNTKYKRIMLNNLLLYLPSIFELLCLTFGIANPKISLLGYLA